MSLESEKPDPAEQELPSLFQVSKPEVFWLRQKNIILSRIKVSQAPRSWARTLAWAAVPFFAGFLGIIATFKVTRGLSPEASPQAAIDDIPPSQDWDLLDDMEVIEHMGRVKKQGDFSI